MRSPLIAFAGFATAAPTLSFVNSLKSPIDSSLAPSTAGFSNATISHSRGGKSVCINGWVNVHSNTTNNYQIDESKIPTNQTTLTNLLLELFTPGAAMATPELMTVDNTFSIAASICVAKNASKDIPTTVQLLTHGSGFDRFYWDFAQDYSYVDAATDAGHAVFFYDRLGNGMSEHPDARIPQAPLQIELANSIVNLLRGGSISDKKFTKVIGVGHSFGSAITTGVNSGYPTAFDASILTGSGTNVNTTTAPFDFGLNPSIAQHSDPNRFGDLSMGYMCGETVQGVQLDFFRAPGFDPAILEQAFAQRSTMSIGEMLGGPPTGSTAAKYTNPVVVLNGQNDYPYCGGNCSFPTNQAATVQKVFYPHLASDHFATYLAPDAGHGLSLHYSAGAAYDFAFEFLKKHGL